MYKFVTSYLVIYIYYPFPWLEDHPKSISYASGVGYLKSTGSGRGSKKGPFLTPQRGGPPKQGGPPLLSKTDFFEKLPKEDALGRTYGQKMAFFGLFWGGSKKGLFWPFFDPF